MRKNEQSLKGDETPSSGLKKCTMVLPGGQEREKGAESIFEEMISKNIANLMKELIYTSEKLNELQTGKTPRDPHLDTS